MAVIEVAGVLVGVGGLAFGAYQYYQTKVIKERKNRLKELSDELDDIRSRLESVEEGYDDPLSKVDLANQLDLLSKSALAFEFATGQNPRIKLREMSEKRFIRNKEQAVERFKEDNTWVDISATIEDSNVDYSTQWAVDIYDHFLHLPTAYSTLSGIREDYIDILEEFDPGLLDDIESTIDEIVIESHGMAISHQDGIEIELDEYDHVDDISRDIFERFWMYEGIEDDLAQLQEAIERLEETRTAILQASYS